MSYLLLVPSEDVQPTHRRSRRQRQYDRAEQLHSLAQAVIKPPEHGYGDMQEAADEDDHEPYRLLPALGILLAHPNSLDHERLADADGVSVLEAGVATLDRMPAELDLPSAPWYLTDLGLDEARREGGEGVLVGVLDTGVDADHPELDPERIHFAEFSTSGELLSTIPRDAEAHGTGVAGLIVGKTMGIAPQASLAMAAVLTTSVKGKMRGDVLQVLAGLDWLLSTEFRGEDGPPGVDIINASLTLPPDDNGALYALLKRACQINGVLMCAAVGNNGINGAGHVGSPASYDVVLGVGATNQAGTVAWFSDWEPGNKPDLCAPGVNIPICAPDGAVISGGRGTSLASPIVCGVGARLLSEDPEGMGDPEVLREALLSRATGPANPTPGNGNEGGQGSIRL